MALDAIQETALATTFALLRRWGACPEGYRTLAQHLGGVQAYGPSTPIPLSVIVAANGLADALWCLRAVPPEQAATRDRLARLFACDCAEHVLPYFEASYPEDQRPRACIQVARRFALGQATDEELAAAYAAAAAARSAGADGADGAAEREWQTRRLLHRLEASWS